MIKAKVHSIETFGTQEGPGIRFLLFLQGCLARCLYCQNPDTWEMESDLEMDAQEISDRLRRCLPYIESSSGGITVSGGEPLLQIDFLIELFNICRKEKIHTAIDTSAFYDKKDSLKLDKLIDITDLFIVDIKAASEEMHKKITSRELEQTRDFLNTLENKKKPFWIRYVLVPGLNDSSEDIIGLKQMLSQFTFCQKFEFLPYHTLGKHKWKLMGLDYSLNNTSTATSEDVKKAEQILGEIVYSQA